MSSPWRTVTVSVNREHNEIEMPLKKLGYQPRHRFPQHRQQLNVPSQHGLYIIREKSEQALLANEYLIQQINRKYRSAQASYPYIREFFFALIELLNQGCKPEDLISELIKNPDFSYLTLQKDLVEVTSKDFSREKKSAAFIRDALEKPIKCANCGGLIHKNSMTTDHMERKREGGVGSVDNAQLAHPYCNSTVKN